jgi:valyl-tRNA synthetase
MVKGRAYNRDKAFTDKQQKAAWFSLHKVIKEITKAYSPIIPFVTDLIYRDLYGRTVHLESFPKPEEVIKEGKYRELTSLILETNSAIWKFKKGQKIALSASIKQALIPASLYPLSKDLSSMHKIEQIVDKKEEMEATESITLTDDTELILDL